MSIFQMLVKQKPESKTLPMEILRAFQAERVAGQRVNKAIENKLIEVIAQKEKVGA